MRENLRDGRASRDITAAHGQRLSEPIDARSGNQTLLLLLLGTRRFRILVAIVPIVQHRHGVEQTLQPARDPSPCIMMLMAPHRPINRCQETEKLVGLINPRPLSRRWIGEIEIHQRCHVLIGLTVDPKIIRNTIVVGRNVGGRSGIIDVATGGQAARRTGRCRGEQGREPRG